MAFFRRNLARRCIRCLELANSPNAILLSCRLLSQDVCWYPEQVKTKFFLFDSSSPALFPKQPGLSLQFCLQLNDVQHSYRKLASNLVFCFFPFKPSYPFLFSFFFLKSLFLTSLFIRIRQPHFQSFKHLKFIVLHFSSLQFHTLSISHCFCLLLVALPPQIILCQSRRFTKAYHCSYPPSLWAKTQIKLNLTYFFLLKISCMHQPNQKS